MQIDITLVATRRPELLEFTLRSFHKNLFTEFDIRVVYVNIDPIWGNETDDQRVEDLCRSYWDTVVIRRPEEASFGGAVKWLWSQPETEWFFHLEDDWALVSRINVNRVKRAMNSHGVCQISLKRPGKAPPKFRTSPGFVLTKFAKISADLMLAHLDPEKQFANASNVALTEAVSGFYHLCHVGRMSPRVLVDTGRVWRAQRGLEKIVEDGRSRWTEIPEKGDPSVVSKHLRRLERRLVWSSFLPRV